MTVIVQQFSPHSLCITIRIPMGKWNRFKEVLKSLFNLYRGRLVGANEMAAHEPRSPSPTILPSETKLKRHTELMRYTRYVLANEGWRGSPQPFPACKVKKSTRTTEEVQTCDCILFSLCRVADCHLQINVYRDNC